ncbi:hypothetical protein Tco_1565910, partial [Tanacetum coccineum]
EIVTSLALIQNPTLKSSGDVLVLMDLRDDDSLLEDGFARAVSIYPLIVFYQNPFTIMRNGIQDILNKIL